MGDAEVATPDEIANAMLFLASDEARMINVVTLVLE